MDNELPILRIWEHTDIVSPTCTICETVYQTKAYGGDLECCPRCQVVGANYRKEMEIENLAHQAKLDSIKARWRRKMNPELVLET